MTTLVDKMNHLIFSSMLIFLLAVEQSQAFEANEEFKRAGITRPKENLMAPEFQLRSLKGGMLSLSDFRGQLIILNFWGTFCAPCREEMPALERLWQRHKNKGLTVLGVAVDREEQAVVEQFIDTYHIDFPIVHDPTDHSRTLYEVTGFPFSYFIDQQGRIIGRVIGAYDWDAPQMQDLITQLLSSQDGGNTEGLN